MPDRLTLSPLGSIELYINTLLLTEKKADIRTTFVRRVWTT